MNDNPYVHRLHPGMSTEVEPAQTPGELMERLPYRGSLRRAQEVLHAPLSCFDRELVQELMADYAVVPPLVARVEMDTRLAGWIHEFACEEITEIIASGGGAAPHLIGAMDVLAARGYPVPDQVVEKMLPRIDTEKDAEMFMYVLMCIPAPRVDEEVLMRIWSSEYAGRVTRTWLLDHPAAGPALWERFAQLGLSILSSNRSLSRGMLDVLVGHPDCVRARGVNRVLMKSGESLLRHAALPYADPADFADAWRALVEENPSWAARVLSDASDDQRAALHRADLAPLLASERAEVRLAAVTAIGTVSLDPVERRREVARDGEVRPHGRRQT